MSSSAVSGTQFHHRRAVCASLLAGLWCWVGSAKGQAPGSSAPLLASMKEARTLAEDYAAIVRKRFAKNSTPYQRSEELYAVARSRYAGVLQEMKHAIENGDLRKLEANSALKRSAAQAQTAADAFFAYVDAALARSQSKGIVQAVAVLGSIAAVVAEVIGSIDRTAKSRSQLRAERAEKAKSIEADLAWRAWNDLPAS